MFVGRIANGINTGNGKIFFVKTAEGSGCGIIVEGSVFFGEKAVVDVVKLNAFKSEIDGYIAKFFKAVVVPAAGGK